MKLVQHFLAVVAVLVGAVAFAHEHAAHGQHESDGAVSEATAFGSAGDPRHVRRTVRIAMSDRMRFTPDEITVRRGETIRFVIANHGAMQHELVLGTAHELAEHAALMKKFPGMEHDDPGMAHVKPGTAGEIVWQFTTPGTFEYACLIPGHFEAGMRGRIIVK